MRRKQQAVAFQSEVFIGIYQNDYIWCNFSTLLKILATIVNSMEIAIFAQKDHIKCANSEG